MTLNKFTKKLEKLIEDSKEFIVYDTENDSDFHELKSDNPKLERKIVVCGENEKETFTLSIIKVNI